MIDYTYRSRALAFISPGLGELTTAPPVEAAAGVDIRRVPVLVYELPPVHPRTGDCRVEQRLVVDVGNGNPNSLDVSVKASLHKIPAEQYTRARRNQSASSSGLSAALLPLAAAARRSCSCATSFSSASRAAVASACARARLRAHAAGVSNRSRPSFPYF